MPSSLGPLLSENGLFPPLCLVNSHYPSVRAWGTPYLCQAVPPDLSRWHPSLIINSRGLCQAPGNGACSVPFSPWSQLISCQGRGRHLGERGLIAPASIRLVSPHTCEVDALSILPRTSLSSEWSGRMFMATTKEEAGLGFKYMGLCPRPVTGL